MQAVSAASARSWRDPVPAYWSTFIAIGMALSVLGPALSQLRDTVGTDNGGIAILFVAQSLGYLIGPLTFGRLFDRDLGHAMMLASLGVIVVAISLLPSVDSLPGLFVICALNGLGCSIVDTGGNTLLLWARRGTDSAPAMNVLHLLFGVGALSAPLLVDVGLRTAVTVNTVVAFAVGGFLATRTQPSCELGVRPAADGAAADPRMLALVTMFFVLYVGVEIGFAGWIHTYAEEIRLPGKSAPALLTALFWATFTVGRLIAVPVSRRIGPYAMVLWSSVIAVVAALLLTIGDSATAMVWISTGLFGIGVAAQFPMMVSFADDHLHLSGSDTAWFVAGAGAGGLMMPWVIGQIFDIHGATAMPVTVLGFTVVTLAWFVVTARALHATASTSAPASAFG